ncbi:MAG TPA: GtrA family protein [Candidatus Dormibacteraeota bacterium]|jgi:putative flippase GtrA|nr:GtrA family protein [Candidatus Dormibacteraeota bacterium]
MPNDDLSPHPPVISQARSFVAIGVVSTLAYIALFGLLRAPLTPAVANGVALALTTVGNTAANRRFTFAVRGRRRQLRDHSAGILTFAVALGITTGALALLTVTDPSAPALVGAVVLVTANLVATAVRFAVLRAAITRRAENRPRPDDGGRLSQVAS